MARKTKTTAKPRSRSAVHERSQEYRAAAADQPVHYIESSALMAALLENDTAVLDLLNQDTRLVTSALTFAECFRALVRGRETGRLSAAAALSMRHAVQTIQRRCDAIAVSDEVLTRAGQPFPVEPVRSLDAIHLATLELLGPVRARTIVISRDRRVRANARQLGFALA